MKFPSTKLEDALTLCDSGEWGEEPVGNNGIPVIRVADVKADNRISYETAPLREIPTSKREEKTLRNGDILVVKSSGSGTSVISGRAALVSGVEDGKYGFANFLLRLRTESRRYNPRFLLYVLGSPAVREQVLAIVGATTYPNLRVPAFKQICIPNPTLAEQERMVKQLDEADELRTLRAKADRRTADLVPALFHEMFGDPVENPKGHPVQQLEQLCTRITDGTHQPPPFTGNGIPFLFVRNIVSGSIDFDTEKFITEETFAELTRRVKPERGDVLYSTVGSYGVAVQVETDRKFAFQRHIGHLKPNCKVIDSGFLAAQLNTPSLKSQADQRARGIAQKTLNLAEIRKFKVLVPPLPVQKEFAKRVTEIRDLEAQQAASRERLDALFQSMLHRAFRGEL